MVPARNAIVTIAHCHPVAQSHPEIKVSDIGELRGKDAYLACDIAEVSLATWWSKFRDPMVLSSRGRRPTREIG